MLSPLPTHDEPERLAALVSCGVLDSEPEAAFDDIAQLARLLCNTPIALVSLVDRSRQWFKAKVGLVASETPRSFSFCAHAIVAREPLVVPDALADPRFADNPLVTGEPYIRFYAGVPLLLEDGFAVGTLCVIDRVPRELGEAQRAALTMLARRAVTELTLRRRLLSEARGSAGEPADSTARTLALPSSVPPPHGPAALPVPVGAVVADRYRIERLLGVGGMGVVAAARDLAVDQPVAIKFMHAYALGQPQALARFVREAQVLFTLKSEHIARVHDVGNLASGAPFIVMELLEGEDLAARLARQGTLSVRESLDLVHQACSAIVTAHAQGVLHRDLKPANLFLTRTPSGRALLKVLDFGISKRARGNAHDADADADAIALTAAETSLGSPHYMSPEQMLGAGEVDGRTDIWSLGVVLYELLSGRPPYPGTSLVDTYARVLTSELPSLSAARPGLPEAVCTIVTRCLQKEPSARYQTASALADDLVAALSSRFR